MPDYLDIPNPLGDLFRHAKRAIVRKANQEIAGAGQRLLRRATQPVRDARDKVQGFARGVDRGVAQAQAGVCAAPAGLVSETDWAGEAILKRYLAGEGDWHIRDDPKWTAYMQASEVLRRQIYDELAKSVVANTPLLKPGGTAVIQSTFHAEIENGEGMVGYQYLHGTNSTAGDFSVIANLHTVHVAESGNVEFSATLRLTWNDLIDPNPQYTTDNWKNRYAEACTFSRAKAYRISISWAEKRNLVWNSAKGYLRDK